MAWAAFAGTGVWLAVSAQVGTVVATSAIALFFTTLFVGLGVFVARLPLDLTKLPHPDYWLTPEHRREFKALIADLMYQLGAALVVFAALINIGTFVQGDWYAIAIVATMVALVLAPTIRFNRQLDRIPRASKAGTDPDVGSG
jgi:hypothetical protein